MCEALDFKTPTHNTKRRVINRFILDRQTMFSKCCLIKTLPDFKNIFSYIRCKSTDFKEFFTKKSSNSKIRASNSSHKRDIA